MVAVASRATSPLYAPPPSPPPLPSPPAFTPSPPAARRVSSDASLDSDDVKPSVKVIRTLSSSSSPPLRESVSRNLRCSFNSPPVPPVPSMSTATASSSSSSSPSSAPSSSSSFASSPHSAFFAESDATDKGSHLHLHSSASSSPSHSESSDSAIQSPVESYVQDIGSPIVRQREDLLHSCVPRSSITRTYDSSDDDVEQSSNNAHVHTSSSSKSSPTAATTSNPSRRSRSMSRHAHMSQFPDGYKHADSSRRYKQILQDDCSDGEEVDHHTNDNDDSIIDDHDHNEREHDVIVIEKTSHTKRSRPVYQQRRSRHRRATHTFCKPPTNTPSCSRVEKLSERVDVLSRELAALQMFTAGRAADADVMKSSTNDRSTDGLLRGEVCRLRITLNHVAKLTLEKAFSVRDELEKHR